MEAGTGKYERTYECMAVAAVPAALGQATGACDAVISLSLSEMLFCADQFEISAFSGKLQAFDYFLCLGSGEFDL